MVASAVLQLAQDQGRAAHLVPPQRDPPGPKFPGVMGQAPAEAKANPILSDVAAPAPHFPLDTTGLANDPGVAGLLEKVAVSGRSLG